MSSWLHRLLAIFSLFGALLVGHCGPGGRSGPPKGSEKTPALAPTPSGPEEDDSKPQEPSVPFAMLGGGPQHLHRSDLPGPRSRPRISAKFHCGARISASPVVGPDGTVYIGSVDGTFNALRQSGRMRWSYVCDEPIFSTAAISQLGSVYVGCDDDTLLAFSTSGRLRWTYPMKQDVDGAPIIGEDGVLYVGGDGLHAIQENGKPVFKLWLGGHVSASPSMRHDGVIVVGTHDHRVYAVDQKGTVLFSFSTKGPIQGPVSVLNTNDMVFGSDDGYVYRLAPKGGTRWKFKTGGPVRSGIAVAPGEKTLFVASMDGTLFGLDAATGKQNWRVDTAGPIRASPMLDSNGTIYIGSRDHHLYAIDSADGEIVWRIDLGSQIDSTAAIASGRKLIIGSDDGTVRILEENT